MIWHFHQLHIIDIFQLLHNKKPNDYLCFPNNSISFSTSANNAPKKWQQLVVYIIRNALVKF